MLSTRKLFEITDLNKARLGVAGRAALVGAVGLGIYNKVKGNEEEDDNETTSTLKKPDTPVITPNNATSPIKTQSNRSVGSNITKTTEPTIKQNIKSGFNKVVEYSAKGTADAKKKLSKNFPNFRGTTKKD